MEVLIYNKEMQRMGIIENLTSLLWIRKYSEVGEFEIHIPVTDENLRLIKRQNLIYKKGSRETGIIEDITVENSNLKNEIIAKGRFASAYFSRRVIKNAIQRTGKADEIMQHLISSCESIPNLELESLKGIGNELTVQLKMRFLYDCIVKLAKSSAIGFYVQPDFKKKKMIFKVYKGIDHSKSQNQNSRVIFSKEYQNLNRIVHKENDQLFKNKVYVIGENEQKEEVIISVEGENQNDLFELRETYVEAKDINANGITKDEFEKALKQRGMETLASNKLSESIENETLPDINFIYKVDYDLGDIVTVESKDLNIHSDLRITEIQEVYEDGGWKIIPTFGDTLPETLDWSK